MKPRILHISADYPDCLDGAKTQAIRGLIKATHGEFSHRVISLNRVGGRDALLAPGRIAAAACDGRVRAYRYAAPPALVALKRPMARIADSIAAELRAQDWQPALIHAHKLSIEGVLAERLAQRLGLPFVLTVQGNTDQKLIARRPDRRALMQQIWHGARGVMAFAPWTAAWLTARLGPRLAPPAIIPCIVPIGAVLPPSPAAAGLVRTAFNLEFWENKNLAALLGAVAWLVRAGQPIKLEIAGGGSTAARRAVQHLISQAGLAERARLVGPVAAQDIATWFNGAALFALPSKRESFGMVFAEALLAGTPVIYPRGAAIDGLFGDASYARAAAANNHLELAAVMFAMLADNRAIKAELAAAQAAGQLRLLEPAAVGEAYRAFLIGALT